MIPRLNRGHGTVDSIYVDGYPDSSTGLSSQYIRAALVARATSPRNPVKAEGPFANISKAFQATIHFR